MLHPSEPSSTIGILHEASEACEVSVFVCAVVGTRRIVWQENVLENVRLSAACSLGFQRPEEAAVLRRVFR